LYERRTRVVRRIAAAGRVLSRSRRLLLMLRIFRPARQPTVVLVGFPAAADGLSEITRFGRFHGHERQHAGRRIAVGRRLLHHIQRVQQQQTNIPRLLITNIYSGQRLYNNV